jgi:RNA polymerase sigma-70 factor (ECF subfamily)
MLKKYREFYEAYKTKLFRYLMFKCGNREVSMDIMQESFTRHFQYSRSSGPASPAFLYTIARNALVDFQRHEKRSNLIQDYTLQPSPDLEEDFIVKEECQLVAQAFHELTGEDREILQLVVSGLPYMEIGKLLGMSRTNVKVRVHRARLRLREILEKGDD